MDRRTKICVWIIVGGFINFLLFTFVYIAIGGDASNGFVGRDLSTGEIHYLIGTHLGEPPKEVAWGWFLYSHIHGVSIWITIAAVLLAMLTLVKDHFVSVLKEGGRLVIHAGVTVILLVVIVMTTWSQLNFRYKRKHPEPVTKIGGLFRPASPGLPPPASQPDK